MNSSKSKINLEMIDEVDELNGKKTSNNIEKNSNFNQNLKSTKPSHFIQIREAFETQDENPFNHTIRQRSILQEDEMIPKKNSEDPDDRNFQSPFDDDNTSNRKSSFKHSDFSRKSSENKMEDGFSIYETKDIKALRKYNMPPPRAMIERKEGNECLTEIAFKSKKRNINDDMSFYERQDFNHIKNNKDNENSSNIFESIPTKIIIENFNLIKKESNEDLKLIDLEYERKKSVSIISDQRADPIEKEFSNHKDSGKNIFTFESKNSSGSIQKEEETKSSFTNNTNKIPKVMARMAKNEENKKNKKVSDFESSLPFSSFSQTFDRRKIEEEPRGNDNYKKINIFKKTN